MLLIHKSQSRKKLFFLVITSICSIGALLGLSALTYTPELSHAETVTYNPPIPQYHLNLSDITYMQDMTEQVCQNSYENESKQLIDKRDDKTYWVTKLKDGNCWMTQNLALDLNTAKPLTSELSDVSSSYTPTATTQQNTITKFPSDSDRTFSYNPGEYIYTTPTEQNSCGTTGIARLEGCPNWTPVVGLSRDTTGNEQAHYLAGNYYSYEVATAGYTKDSGSAPNSICPKGWQLPRRSENKSFGTLLNSYGTNSGLLFGTQDIRLAPLYFVYVGFINDSSLDGVGSLGYYWSSTAGTNYFAYILHFTTLFNPSSALGRYRGTPVRCVARGEAVVRPGVPSIDNVTININPQLSLDVTPEVEVEKSEINPSTADLKVKVSSNQPYSVNINAKEHAELISENGDSIPSNGGALTTAENNWGIQKPGESTYTKITTTPQLFYQSTVAEIKTIPFIISISTSPDLPNGEYSTDITITATQN